MIRCWHQNYWRNLSHYRLRNHQRNPCRCRFRNRQRRWNRFWFHFFLSVKRKAYTRLPLPMFLTQGGRTHWIKQAITILQHIMILFHFYHMDSNKILLQPISISKFKQGHQHHFSFSTQFVLRIQKIKQFQAWTSTCISVATYNLFVESSIII